MKKTLISLTLVATALTAQAADGKLNIKMNVAEMGDTVVAIMANDQRNPTTFVGKQGVFNFELDVPKPGLLYLVEPGAMRGDRSARFFQLPAVGGEQVELTATDRSRYDVNGSKFYAQFHEADLTIENAQREGKDVAQTILDFIKDHPDYDASATLLTMCGDYDTMQKALQLLSPQVRDGQMKDFYQPIIDQAEAAKKAEEEAAKKQAPGLPAPDFTLNDLNGKPLALSSLRGKHVILDFWGSWCGWCIKGFPEMKQYYEKYKGKFEILGIDCNDTEQKWRDAVAKHELPWLHVYNPRESQVLNDYAIQGFPTKIIVGPDGKIVKTIVGEDPAFYTLLDELFGK